MQQAVEHDALTTGLALKSNRVLKLQQLAALMEEDIFNGFLWTDQVKMIGTGPFAKEVNYEEFNTAEVQQYRATLDDIAKEVGDRKQANTTLTLTSEELAKLSVEELEALAKKRGLL